MSQPETPVEALMSPQPVALDPEDTVTEALALLERYPFRHVPLVHLNELVGIVSDRDLAFACALPRGKREPGHGPRRPHKIGEIAQHDVLTVQPSTPARSAVRLLLEHRIGALPVVDGKRLVGIVTETDFLRLFERCTSWTAGMAPAEVTVESCMSRPVVTANPDEDLLEAAQRLLGARVRHLPVVSGGALVGMLSDRNVRRSLARLAREDRRAEEGGSAGVPRLTVEQVMSSPCMTIEPGGSLRAAAHTLLECRIGALPVVAGDELVGILSQTDLLQHYEAWSSF